MTTRLRREVHSPEHSEALVRVEQFERGLERRELAISIAYVATLGIMFGSALMVVLSVFL